MITQYIGRPKAYVMLFQLCSCGSIPQRQQNDCSCAIGQ
uniref:Uncharacterized protein n=1 Tax=Anguilla anguilla TaxID=7936 RepID=A0A0E9SPZ3_ANGAN